MATTQNLSTSIESTPLTRYGNRLSDIDAFVPETMFSVKDSISNTLINIEADVPHSTLGRPDDKSHDTSLKHDIFSVSMFDEQSNTEYDDLSMPSIFPMSNNECRQFAMPSSSTPICVQPLSTDDLQLFVTESQLPLSQTASQTHMDVLGQLICANHKISQLKAENDQLRDDLKIKHILESANVLPKDEKSELNEVNEVKIISASEKLEQKVESQEPQQKLPQNDTVHPVDTPTLLFRSNGNLSILSNFHEMRFHFKGSSYHSTEPAYQHQMAYFHKRPDMAYRIMCTRTAGQAKRLAKSVKKCEQWHEHKVELMSEILSAKASQCNAFRTTLQNTGNNHLLHNIETDSFWGCGPDLNGTNMMGVLLMEIRNDLNSRSHETPNNVPNSSTVSYAEKLNVMDKPTEQLKNKGLVLKTQHLPHTQNEDSQHCQRSMPSGSDFPRLSVSKMDAKKTNTVPNQSSSAPQCRPSKPSVSQCNKPSDSSILLIGNSNVRDMASILNDNGLMATSTLYPGGTLNYIRSRIPHHVNGVDPPHIALMVGDVEVVDGMSSEQIIYQYKQIVKEIRRYFPWSRLLLVGLVAAGNPKRQQTTHRLNAFLQQLASDERMIEYVNNCQSKLRDHIHLSHAAKRSLGRLITNLVNKPHLRSLQRFR